MSSGTSSARSKSACATPSPNADEMGDCWLHVAICGHAEGRFSPNVVGKRSPENTEALAMDLRGRILNRPQITSDGYAPYIGAIQVAFQTGVDFAVLTKKYGSDSNLPDAAHRLLARSRHWNREGRDKRQSRRKRNLDFIR